MRVSLFEAGYEAVLDALLELMYLVSQAVWFFAAISPHRHLQLLEPGVFTTATSCTSHAGL